VIIASDVDIHEIAANALGAVLAYANDDELIVYLFNDMTKFDSTNSTNCALLYDAHVLCMNDPDSTCTVYTSGETCDSDPTEVGVDYDWNGEGTVTIYASRESGSPGSISWTQLTRKAVTDISQQESGTTLRLKIVLTGNAALNWIDIVTDVTVS